MYNAYVIYIIPIILNIKIAETEKMLNIIIIIIYSRLSVLQSCNNLLHPVTQLILFLFLLLLLKKTIRKSLKSINTRKKKLIMFLILSHQKINSTQL